MHLGGLQPVRNSVEGYGGAGAGAVGDALQIAPHHRRYAVGPAHPESSGGVFEDVIDTVIGQALLPGVGVEFARFPPEKARAQGSEPQTARRILMNRPYSFRLQPVDHLIAHEFVLVQTAHAMIGADPQVAVAVFGERANAEIAEALRHAVINEAALPPAADTFVGADPEATVTALVNGAHEIVDQSVTLGVLYGSRSFDAPQAVSVSARPQDTGAVAEEVADADFGERAGESIGPGGLSGKAIEARAGDPQAVVEVLVDGAEVGSSGAGQWKSAHRRGAQAHESGLRPHPKISLAIFE